jgi:integrase
MRVPAYRLHKPSGLAVVTIGGRDHYLGRYDSPDSHRAYDRLLGEWLRDGRRPASKSTSATLSVSGLLDAYLEYVNVRYKRNGKPTSEPRNIRLAFKPVRERYGHTAAGEFSPRCLKAVRDKLLAADLCRGEINKRIRRVVRAYKWGVEEELVSPTVYQALKAVEGLRRGQANVRESEPVKPVPDTFIDALEPHVSRQVWSMVELQRLTGMRPGEVCIMRTCDTTTHGEVWEYVPSAHKTEHHGRHRRIILGPRAQQVLRPWLRTELTAYIFSPREAEAERHSLQRETRKSRV